MASWVRAVNAITLFVDDLDTTKTFYADVFGVPMVFEDKESAAFNFGNTIVNLLAASAARELIEPEQVASWDGGARFQLTLQVDDVDARCEQLAALGVEFVNGPIDRPWGVRTACFRDPGGHLWELAH